MKSFKDLSNYLKEVTEKTISNIENAQTEVAQKMWEDVISEAPVKTGEYISSIKVYPIEKSKLKITTFIGSEMMTPYAITTGKRYNLGYLLENGTLHHAIPNAFNWGVIYGYNSPQYFMTCRDDWHPGNVAIPHYKIALEKNKKLYKDKIKEAYRKALK